MEETKENVEKKENKLGVLKNKKVIITSAIVSVLIIVAIIVAVSLFNKDRIKFTGESNGIKYSAKMQEDSRVLVVMKNKTGKTISELELNVTYYDAKGNVLYKSTELIDGYLKNEEITLDRRTTARILDVQKIERYDIEINPKYYDGEEKTSNYEKIEILEQQKRGDKIVVDIKNKTEEEIQDIYFYGVFFKDGLPIEFFANYVHNIDKDTKTLEFNEPKDEEGNKIEYDFCEIYMK